MTLYRNSTVCLFRCERPDLRNHRTRRTATEYERRSYGAGATGAGADQSCAKQSGAKWRDPRFGEQRGIRLMPGPYPLHSPTPVRAPTVQGLASEKAIFSQSGIGSSTL